MIRDRLPELKENLQLSNSRESLVLIEDDEVEEYFEREHNPVMDALLKMYAEMLQEFKLITANIESMKVMTQAVNSKQFSDKEFQRLRQRGIEIGTNLINKFRNIETNLPPADDYSTLSRMKRLLFYGFYQQYIDVWTKNEEFLKEYEEKVKKTLQTQSKILNYDLTDEELDTLIAYKLTSLYTANILETENARKILKDLQERLGEFKKLEKSIGEVHSLFLQLQTLVVDQSVIMQRIEKHFDDARDYVGQGTEQIRQAQVLRAENVKNKFLYIVLAIISILLFTIIAICTLRSKTK